MTVVLVRGTGDVASAVAYALYRAGYSVLLHDSPKASHPRRAMAFVNALYEGIAELDGVLAKRARTVGDLVKMLHCGRAVPVVESPLEKVVAEIHPDVLVDARMRKREQPEPQRGLAPLVIGLGPNFVVGVNADIAIESKWGDELGAVLWSGRTQNLSGEPQEIAGHARDRYVYAPAEGVFGTSLNVGDMVAAGQAVARVGNAVVYAPLSGCLRGIAHDGAQITRGAKILEVDPRGDAESVRGVGERPRRIAEGVLKALSAQNIGSVQGVAKPFTVGALIATLGGLIGLGGAEFRLPALVRLFRFDVREAIAVNVLVTIWRLRRLPSARAAVGRPRFIASMAAGSLLGAFIGSTLVGIAPEQVLSLVLAVILAISAIKTFGK